MEFCANGRLDLSCSGGHVFSSQYQRRIPFFVFRLVKRYSADVDSNRMCRAPVAILFEENLAQCFQYFFAIISVF